MDQVELSEGEPWVCWTAPELAGVGKGGQRQGQRFGDRVGEREREREMRERGEEASRASGCLSTAVARGDKER